MESKPGVWCYNALYSDKLDEKARFNVPDTVLFDNGVLDKYVFTNRTGVVVKKRTVSQEMVIEKFAKIASASALNHQCRSCVVRYRDGSSGVLDAEAFSDFMEVWPPSDPSIVAVQSYIQGRGKEGMVFRSTYNVVNSSGRVSIQHSSFLSLPKGCEEEPTVKVPGSGDSLTLSVSKGASTNETFSTILKAAISQIEKIRKCKIICISADFMIDANDQVWLLWLDNIKFVTGEMAKDLAGLNVGIYNEPDMRGSWLHGISTKPFPSAKEQMEIAAAKNAKPKRPSTSPVRRSRRKLSKTTAKVTDDLMGAMAVRLETEGEVRRQDMRLAMSRTVFSDANVNASSTSEVKRPASPFKSKGYGAGNPVSLQLLGGEGPKEEAMAARIERNMPAKSRFPSNMKCNGDFCSLKIRDASELINERGDGGKILSSHVQLSEEYVCLRKLKKSQMDSLLQNVRKLSTEADYTVPYASVYRARKERAAAEESYRSHNHEVETAWQAYPSTPREQRRKFQLDEDYWKLAKQDEVEHPTKGGSPEKPSAPKNNASKQTASSTAKKDWGKQRGEVSVPGGANNFYRQVHVCGECSRAYMLLDKAREIMLSDKLEDEEKQKFYAANDGDSNIPGALEQTRMSRMKSGYDAEVKMRKAANMEFTEDSFMIGQGSGITFGEGSSSFIDAQSATEGEHGVNPTNIEYLFSPSKRAAGVKRQESLKEDSSSRPMTSPIQQRQRQGRARKAEGSSRPMTSPVGMGTPSKGVGQGSNNFAAPHFPNTDSIANQSDVAFQDNPYYTKPIPRRRTTALIQKPGSPPRPSWRTRRDQRRKLEQEYEERGEKIPQMEAFGGQLEKLDKFLRGTGEEYGHKNHRRAAELTENSASASYVENFKSQADNELYHGKVLIAFNDMNEAEPVAQCLEDQGYMVAFEQDGITVMDILNGGNYDCLLVQNDLFVKNAKEITAVVRDREKSERKKATRTMAYEARNRNQSSILGDNSTQEKHPSQGKYGHPNQVKSLSILVYTEKVAPSDLKGYMEAGMDGCLSRPFDADALITTLRQAIPKHLKPIKETEVQENANKRKMYKTNFTVDSKPTNDSSSDLIAKTLALSNSFTNNEGCLNSVLQFDADTMFPYTVMDSSIDSAGGRGSKTGMSSKKSAPYFNLVVVHDIFDTCERMKILLKPISRRYPGLQILLWNYPGQAFTEFREEQLLNNEYHAQCLNGLLEHVGQDGTKQFDTNKPFYLMGYGNGGNIASFYSAFYNNKNLRSLILFNSFSYVDPHMASVLHDCMNVFSCSAPNRPDLPIYFFARFLFSPTYLSSVSTPLALNLYTAVHNPISLKGRIQLCLGALSHIDLRNSLKEIPVAVIQVQSTQDALVRPMHSEPYISKRDGETKSIHRCLQAHANNPYARRTCLVWVNSGHEIFQEKRSQALQLIEQLVIGYHEANDVSFMPAMSVDKDAALEMDKDLQSSLKMSAGTGGGRKPLASKSLNTIDSVNFEDQFVDNLIGKLGSLNKKKDSLMKRYEDEDEGLSYEEKITKEKDRWDSFSENVSRDAAPIGAGESGNNAGRRVGKRISKYSTKGSSILQGGSSVLASDSTVRIVTDPTRADFEKNNKVVYGFKKNDNLGLYQNPEEYPEVQEYMGWRLKRNKKRLARLDAASKIIQGAYRAHLAWQIITKLRQERATCYIQRCYRGWRGR